MVKIVSVLAPIFTSENVLKNGINITTLDQLNLALMRMCISGLSVKNRILSGIRN